MTPSPRELAHLFGGSLDGDAAGVALRDITTDSRSVRPGDAFVAVRGEREDGHRYVAAAVAQGAALVVVDASWRGDGDAGGPLLLRVDDTAAALRRACRTRLAELGSDVVGITGSAGKTTAKELCALALGGRNVARTPGNLNTWTGIPLGVLRMQPPVDVFVAELAMSAPGEIADLCRFVRPRTGLLLNVGHAHVGLLGSVEAIADAKAELLDALPGDGTACLNADDPQVRRVSVRSRARICWFGTAPGAEVRAGDITTTALGGSTFTLHTPSGSAQVRLPVPGRHVVVDACAAAAVAWSLGVGPDEFAERVAGFAAAEHRGVLRAGPEGSAVYDDSYNSSPSSLAAALDVLEESGTATRVAVLGDMLELGAHTRPAHLEAGRLAARAATHLVALGEQAPTMVGAARDAGMARERACVARDVDEAVSMVRALCGPDVTVLVKASHSLALDRIVEALLR